MGRTVSLCPCGSRIATSTIPTPASVQFTVYTYLRCFLYDFQKNVFVFYFIFLSWTSFTDVARAILPMHQCHSAANFNTPEITWTPWHQSVRVNGKCVLYFRTKWPLSTEMCSSKTKLDNRTVMNEQNSTQSLQSKHLAICCTGLRIPVSAWIACNSSSNASAIKRRTTRRQQQTTIRDIYLAMWIFHTNRCPILGTDECLLSTVG